MKRPDKRIQDEQKPLTEIRAQPTKTLFIEMLTKDLTLADAISDLVDNSVDGARRLRGKGSLKGLSVDIEATEKYFQISDNCGGIEADIARRYAFCFGRPDDMPPTPGSIGRFGIGMKRALFKLGKHFSVESTAKNSSFKVEENVEDWKKRQEDEWHFNFSEVKENLPDTQESRRETTIRVTKLDDAVSKSLADPIFVGKLKKSLELHHLFSLQLGLGIKINGHRLNTGQLMLFDSKDFKTAYWHHEFEDRVTVKAYAGIYESDLDAGGWYVFCNGRLILGPDQTLTTGWGEKPPSRIPKYHGQYERFRGYVIFESDDADLLPWDTTKTGVDVDSVKWKFVRGEMIKMMRPVLNFLNQIHRERQGKQAAIQEAMLEKAIGKTKSVTFSQVRTAEIFEAPKPKDVLVVPPQLGRIVYEKPMRQIEKAKEVLGVETLSEVGEKTFDYFFKAECS